MILAIFLFIIAAVVAFILLAGYKESHYYKFATPGGEIEEKYKALGSYDVSSVKYTAGNDVWKKYEIWYPTEMKDSGKTIPLSLWQTVQAILSKSTKRFFSISHHGAL